MIVSCTFFLEVKRREKGLTLFITVGNCNQGCFENYEKKKREERNSISASYKLEIRQMVHYKYQMTTTFKLMFKTILKTRLRHCTLTPKKKLKPFVKKEIVA